MPLANSFLRSPNEFASESRYPLDVYFCETCFLVQLLDVVNPEILFSNYIYLTGTSETMAAHNAQYVHTLLELQNVNSEDLVIEIASNDGSFLKCFDRHKVKTLGIEPATNIAAIANAKGVQTTNRFFNSSTAQQVLDEYGAARIVVANNVLAHVDDTIGFLRGCKTLLTPDGLLAIEVPYFRELIARLEYDTFYHEHLCYFSITTLMSVFEAGGLSILRVDSVPVHGGSVRIYAARKEQHPTHSRDVSLLGNREQKAGMNQFAYYEGFAERVEKNRQALRSLLQRLIEEGKSLAGYGAPAKGNTLLNFCEIDSTLIPFIVDKSPLKVGLFTPGMHIPVLSVSTLEERQPDYTILIAWNFAEEIMQQQKLYRERGGRFIIPIPDPRIV